MESTELKPYDGFSVGEVEMELARSIDVGEAGVTDLELHSVNPNELFLTSPNPS